MVKKPYTLQNEWMLGENWFQVNGRSLGEGIGDLVIRLAVGLHKRCGWQLAIKWAQMSSCIKCSNKYNRLEYKEHQGHDMISCLHELVDVAGHVSRQLRGAREAAGVQQETDYVLLVSLDRDGADCGCGHLERLHIRQEKRTRGLSASRSTQVVSTDGKRWEKDGCV